MRALLTTLIELAGMGAIVAGIALISVPSAVIVAGLLLIAVGFLTAVPPVRR